jgi:hypothetical protein
MRIIISRLVILFAKRNYLPRFLKELDIGWQTKEDLQALEAVKKLAQERLRHHFLFRYRFKEDFEAILFCIQNIYHSDKSSEKLKFSFSIKKLVYCALLGFCDIYKEFSQKKWFKLIQNVRLIWFWRLTSFNKLFQSFFDIPLINKLHRTRLLGQLLRLLLIPLLGVPLLLWYVLKSISVSILYEGFFRFLYGILFLKVGYYAIYLYGRNNTIINKRIEEIPKKRISEIHKDMEEMMSQTFQTEKSKHFANAFEKYQSLLIEFGIGEDEKLKNYFFKSDLPFNQRIGKKLFSIIKRILTSTKEAFKKQNPFTLSQTQDKEQFLKLYSEIGKVYFPRIKEPILMLRFRESIELGYLASISALNLFFTNPGTDILFSNISLDFILKVKAITKQDFIRKAFSKFNSSYKYLSIFNKAYQVIRVARGIITPYNLIFSLGSPIVFQNVQNIIKEFVFHKTGRLLLYSWESNTLKRTGQLTPLLW